MSVGNLLEDYFTVCGFFEFYLKNSSIDEKGVDDKSKAHNFNIDTKLFYKNITKDYTCNINISKIFIVFRPISLLRSTPRSKFCNLLT